MKPTCALKCRFISLSGAKRLHLALVCPSREVLIGSPHTFDKAWKNFKEDSGNPRVAAAAAVAAAVAASFEVDVAAGGGIVCRRPHLGPRPRRSVGAHSPGQLHLPKCRRWQAGTG